MRHRRRVRRRRRRSGGDGGTRAEGGDGSVDVKDAGARVGDGHIDEPVSGGGGGALRTPTDEQAASDGVAPCAARSAASCGHVEMSMLSLPIAFSMLRP